MITAEGRVLADHWSRYGRKWLDSYLIQDVEHPAINAQSILVRSFLVDRLFPGRFVTTIEAELHFSACACHVLQQAREGRLREFYDAIRDPDQDPMLPDFLRKDFRAARGGGFDLVQLVTDLASRITLGFEDFLSPFQSIWQGHLQGLTACRPRLIEMGCGSANDYRFWNSFGIASHLDYVGIDVCAANIRNAKLRFSDTHFAVGDVCSLEEADRSFDVVVGFDVLEHLSPDGLDTALREIERLSRDEIWLSLFSARDIVEHDYLPVEDYHWNTLSLSALSHHLGSAGYITEIVPIADELEHRFPGYKHYNDAAHLVIGKREAKRAVR